MKLLKPWVFALFTLTLVSTGLILTKSEILTHLSSDDYLNRLTRLEQKLEQNQLTPKYRDLVERLDELEKIISISHRVTPDDQTEISDYLTSLENRQSTLEEFVYESLSVSADAGTTPFNQNTADSQRPDDSKINQADLVKINNGLILLDETVDKGELDDFTLDQFNQLVSNMNNEGKKQLWERLFADLQAGKYQMPDIEPSQDHTYLPDDEVTGE